MPIETIFRPVGALTTFIFCTRDDVPGYHIMPLRGNYQNNILYKNFPFGIFIISFWDLDKTNYLIQEPLSLVIIFALLLSIYNLPKQKPALKYNDDTFAVYEIIHYKVPKGGGNISAIDKYT